MSEKKTALKFSRLNAALSYANRGWHVIPLHTPVGDECSCGRENCSSVGKHPRTKNGLRDATKDPDTIRRWWTRWPEANVGIVTGAKSGLVVLDQDGPEAEESLKDKDLPSTLRVSTGKGIHWYFSHPGGIVRNFTRRLPGLDLRGDGGYVVAPPSLHSSGHRYEWADSLDPETVELAPCPDWLVELARKGSKGQTPTPLVEGQIPEGQRNAKLTSLAGSMRRRDMSEKAILAALREENAIRCAPPLLDSELVSIAHSIARYPPAAATYHRTDLGNAELLIELFGDRVHYVHPWKRWLLWDGQRWVPDPGGGIDHLASLTVRERLRRAADIEDQDERSLETKWAFTSESAKHKNAALDWAKSQPGVPILPKDLDTNSWLLNVQNGTLDLRTGERKPHDPADHITKIAPVHYDPKAATPLWENLLNKITGNDEELKTFLQRAVGYSLTGDTGEEVLFFVHGPTNTGKSTFMEAVKAMLGEYSKTTDFETFLKRRGDAGIRNDIARLAGARHVVSIEVDEGKKLAEGLIKALTGGDTVSARFLHKEYFEYVPQLKLWLAANNKPAVTPTDTAMWKRILLVPFIHEIPEVERDPEVKRRLRDPSESGPAILAWAIKGCLEWQKNGLQVPKKVAHATDKYREEMDTLSDFLADRCVEHTGARVVVDELYRAYKNWAEESGERPMSKRALGMRLSDRGFESGHDGKQRVRHGIALQGLGGPPAHGGPTGDAEEEEEVPF